MRTVDIRRHSLRGSGSHLSDAGRRLAAEVAETMAPAYDLVLSSDKVRARETAEAMGFPVHAEDPAFGIMNTARLTPWFAEIAQAAATHACDHMAAALHVPGAAQELHAYATQYVDTVRTYLGRIPDGGRLLLVSHGGTIEQVAALFATEFTLEAIGGAFAPCEGFSLSFADDGRVTLLDIHRVSAR